MSSARTRQLLAVLLVATPVALAVVYGLRDAPTEYACVDRHVWEVRVDDYRGTLWSLAPLAEVVAVAVLGLALAAARGAAGWVLDHAIGMVSAGVVLAIWAAGVAGDDYDNPFYLGLLFGLPAGALVWWLLNLAVDRAPTSRRLAVVALWLFAEPVVGLLVVGLSQTGLEPPLLRTGAAVAGAVVLVALAAWLGPRICHDDDDAAGWSALALAAAIVGVLIVPATGLIIVVQADGQNC